MRLLHFAVIGAALPAAGVLALWAAGLQLPLVTLAAAFGASALLREATESARAQRETGRLLRSLVDADGDPEPGGERAAARPERATPRGATGRLALARELQERLIRDRNLRRALLDSLEDGVIRWDAEGRVVLANAAAATLWGGPSGEAVPDREELLAAAEAADDGPGTSRGAGRARRRPRRLRLLRRGRASSSSWCAGSTTAAPSACSATSPPSASSRPGAARCSGWSPTSSRRRCRRSPASAACSSATGSPTRSSPGSPA